METGLSGKVVQDNQLMEECCSRASRRKKRGEMFQIHLCRGNSPVLVMQVRKATDLKIRGMAVRALFSQPAFVRLARNIYPFEREFSSQPRKLTIPDAFDESAAKYESKEACVMSDGTRRTFKQFHLDVAKFSSGLQDLRLERHSRIAIFAPTCYEWLVAKYAINRAGCVVVALNAGAHEAELRYVLDKTETKAVILGRPFKFVDHYETLCAAFPSLGSRYSCHSLKHIIEMDDNARKGSLRTSEMMKASVSSGAAIAADDPAVIIQSSGSTGKPKSIVLTHANIVVASDNNFTRMRLRRSNKVLASLPLYHSFGYVCIEATDTLNGLTTAYTSMKPKPEETLRMIAQERVTTLHGTPTTFYDILHCPEFAKTDVSSLENGTIGATTLHSATIAEIIAKLDLKDFMLGYGLTETAGACSFADGKNFDGYELFDGTEVRISKDLNGVAEPGEKGEIQLRGPTVFKEYLNDQEKTTAVKTSEGWFRTGDMGMVNENSKLIVNGRMSDLIIKGGVNIAPAEIEPVLLEHPKILEAHVVGVMDDRLGEEICAWIRVEKGHNISSEAVKAFATERLSRIKVPKYVVTTEDFPKTSVGKISKMKLREAFEQMEGSQRTSE